MLPLCLTAPSWRRNSSGNPYPSNDGSESWQEPLVSQNMQPEHAALKKFVINPLTPNLSAPTWWTMHCSNYRSPLTVYTREKIQMAPESRPLSSHIWCIMAFASNSCPIIYEIISATYIWSCIIYIVKTYSNAWKLSDIESWSSGKRKQSNYL